MTTGSIKLTAWGTRDNLKSNSLECESQQNYIIWLRNQELQTNFKVINLNSIA